MANLLVSHALTTTYTYKFLIELDCGDGRGGISPESPRMDEIASAVSGAPRVQLTGVITHAGQAYHARSDDEMKQHAEEERQSALRAVQRLEALQVPCQIVSIGSTPTAMFTDDLSGGITELRAGVYIFSDLFQASVRSSSREDIALTVLCTIIGHNEDKNQMLVDAGGLALSKDRSLAECEPALDYQYGLVCDVKGRVCQPLLVVQSCSQEHGKITLHQAEGGTIDFASFPLGSNLRILPNHSCMTAAAHPHYWCVAEEGSTEILDKWTRCNYW